jgi:hypothetical protein
MDDDLQFLPKGDKAPLRPRCWVCVSMDICIFITFSGRHDMMGFGHVNL